MGGTSTKTLLLPKSQGHRSRYLNTQRSLPVNWKNNKKKETVEENDKSERKIFSSTVQITIMNGSLHLTHSGPIHFKCNVE